MICPKCGQEYEGSTCPHCSTPEIIVNNNDYLRRRKMYEEKQAEEKSASLNEQKNNAVSNASSKSSVSTKGEPELVNPEVILADSVAKLKSTSKKLKEKAVTKTSEVVSSTKEVTGKHLKKKKLWKWIMIGAAILVIGIASGVGIYKLAIRKNYVLYMSSDTKIYNVSNLESKYVCDVKDAIFAADQVTFFKPDYPSEINRDNVTDTLASNSGKYFAVVTYNSDNSMYTLYLWNSDQCFTISSNKYNKSIKCVTDKGKVIYTDTDIVNSEGGVGAVQLYIAGPGIKSKGNTGNTMQVLIDNNIRNVCVYTDIEQIIYLNKNNSLYTYDYNKMSGKTSIAEEVKSVYLISGETKNLYTNSTLDINESSGASALFYNTGNKYYYYDLDKKKETYIFKSSDGINEIIYDHKNDRIYTIDVTKLATAELADQTEPEFTSLDSLGLAKNLLYMPDSNEILYINGEQQLITVNKGNAKKLTDNVVDGTLCLVGNTKNAFTYVKNGVQYYKSSLNANEVRLYKVTNEAAMNQTILYKNQLYFYNEENHLFTCSVKGTNDNEIGMVDRFWLGKEYK